MCKSFHITFKVLFRLVKRFSPVITKEKDVQKTFSIIRKKFKKINVLINNAAIDSVPNKKIKTKKNALEKFDINNWNKEIEVGLTGALICTKYFGNFMSKQKKGGVILNISSDLGMKRFLFLFVVT